MKFASFSHVWNKPGMTAAERYEQLWRELALCDEVGYDPIRIVEEVAVLDNVPHGRLEVGLVSGIVPDYVGPYRADFENRRALADEGLALINQWTLAENYVKRGELGAAEIARNMTNMDYLLKRNVVFVGSPATVAARIREAAEGGLFNTVFCEFNLGSMGEDELMRSIRLFGTEVIPALRGYDPC